MRTALALLLMAAQAAAQKTIEATPRDGEVDHRPAFICDGKTDLPETSRLDIFLCFGAYQPGRHLTYRATEVKDGKFQAALPVFKTRTLAGSYTFHIEFNPYQQQPEVQKALGRNLRMYSTDATLQIGTDAEIAADRKRTFGRLGAEIDVLRDLLETAVKKMDETASVEIWQAYTASWLAECHRAIERNHDIPEYRALGVDDISEQTFEDLSTSLYRLLEACVLCVAHPGNPVLLKAVEMHRKGFGLIRRQAMIRLGLEKASNREVSQLLPPVRSDFPELLKLYQAARKGDSDVRNYYQAKVTLAKRHFRERLLAVVDVAPDRHLDALRSIQEKGLAYLRTLAESASDWKADRTEDLQDLLDGFEKELSALLTALKE